MTIFTKNGLKVILAAISLMSLTNSALASDNSSDKWRDFFIGASVEKYSTSSKVLDSMRVDQLMPNGTPIHLELGWYVVPSYQRMGAKVWFDLYSDSKRNSEKGVGLHGVGEWRIMQSLPINFYFGGGAYFARQSNNGKTFVVDNPKSASGFILGGGSGGKGNVTMNKNSTIIGLDVMTGFSVNFTESFFGDLGYVGKYRRANFGYTINGLPNTQTNISEDTFDHSVRLGLGFRF